MKMKISLGLVLLSLAAAPLSSFLLQGCAGERSGAGNPFFTQLAPPSGLVASGGTGLIQLDWANNSEPTLASYSVYRSSNPSGSLTLLARNVHPSSYTDSSVGPVMYYYAVRAVDSSGRESEASEMASAMPTELPPSDYEGFGSISQGALGSPDGYQVYRVTSLADSTAPGTLRDALGRGKRYIVFDVGGTITLNSNLEVRYSYVTIDGKSAPSPGITILQPNLLVTAIEAYSSSGPVHDVIIHHLRMDGGATGQQDRGDIWGLDGETLPVYKVVIDHCTGNASNDGIFDIWGDVKDVTISWNLITGTVLALNIFTPDASLTRDRISIHHNVFARNNERQVKIRYNSTIDYVNNVVYGWGWMEGLSGSLNIAYDSGVVNPSLNVEDSVLHYVSGLAGSPDQAIFFGRGPDEGQVYFHGNRLPPEEADAVSSGGRLAIPSYAEVTHHSADSLGSNVVPFAGTHHPTSEEAALLSEIQAAITP